MIDLFGIDEVKWIGAPDYADRVCVLTDSVRDFLVRAGRDPAHIVVTGNPGFDGLNQPDVVAQGQALRAARGWLDKRVVLWPRQVEPAVHPFNGQPGDADLPARTFARVLGWALSRPDVVLCVRPRAGEATPDVPEHPRIWITGQDWPLAPLLHATDLVATLNSTVGLEGRLAGCRLVQVLGSVFDAAMPLHAYGLADAAVPEAQVGLALDQWVMAGRHSTQNHAFAARRVLEQVQLFL